jgi:hypothetical protein
MGKMPGGIRAFVLSLLLASSAQASAVSSAEQFHPAGFSSLRSIAGWLKREGADGWLAADVADAVGIPRLATEELLEARQRGFRDDEALRVVQLSADERRDFLLFMVQQPDGRVYFYLAGLREGLKGAYVSVRGAVSALDRVEAEPAFQRELQFWKGRVAAVR